jgi:plastocyanin
MAGCATAGVSAAQSAFHAKVTVESASPRKDASNANVVVWLTPSAGETPPVEPKRVRLAQHNKQFEPHLLVIPVGSTVDFPNEDPFFHNVFSLYKGKRFDLGLYEAGSSRAVKFDKPGVSFIFCNIHPEMSAVIVAMPTPYFGVSNASGDVTIPDVPAGRYRVETWYERSSSDLLGAVARDVTLPGASTIALRVRQTVEGPIAHKNKFGKDYDKVQHPYPE